MGSLYIERLLNFRIRREKEMGEDDGWNEEGDECICPQNQLDTCYHREAWELLRFAIPMRCRIAANVSSFKYHHGRTATEFVNIYTRRALLALCQPYKAPLLSPQSARASNSPSKLLHPSSPDAEDDIFRLGQPLLRYMTLRSCNSNQSPKAHPICSINPPRQRRRRTIRGQIPCAQ